MPKPFLANSYALSTEPLSVFMQSASGVPGLVRL